MIIYMIVQAVVFTSTRSNIEDTFGSLLSIDWATQDTSYATKVDVYYSNIETAQDLIRELNRVENFGFILTFVCLVRLVVYLAVHPRIAILPAAAMRTQLVAVCHTQTLPHAQHVPVARRRVRASQEGAPLCRGASSPRVRSRSYNQRASRAAGASLLPSTNQQDIRSRRAVVSVSSRRRRPAQAMAQDYSGPMWSCTSPSQTPRHPVPTTADGASRPSGRMAPSTPPQQHPRKLLRASTVGECRRCGHPTPHTETIDGWHT